MRELRPALVLFALISVVTGMLYPALVTGFAQALFPTQANGSLVRDAYRVRGSALIGQPFADAGHFWGRPSATAPFAYNAAASSGSNLGPSNPALADAIKSRVETLRAADPEGDTEVPVDLVTTSGSGLDPHISIAAATFQVPRVARARGLSAEQVQALIDQRIEARTLGILGEPRINVLFLNLDLDRFHPAGT